MERIALFAPYLPAPPTSGGRIRSHHLARAVAKRAELCLFAAASRRELTAEALRHLDVYTDHFVAPAPLPFVPGARRPRRVRNGVPLQLGWHFWRQHQARPFSRIWVEHTHASRIAMKAGLPWLLDEHNIESRYLQQKLAAGRPAVTDRLRVARLRRWEERTWRAAKAVVAVTEADANAIAAVTGTVAPLVPNGVDLDAVAFRPPSARHGQEVLFVGLMNHPPNEKAAARLATEVMPTVWARHPDARLVLCGANPSAAVRALQRPRVEVTGTVVSVQPYLDRARVYANLLAHGGGSSLKVLEALAAGIPFVSTELGVRGFPLENGRHYRRADSSEAMAKAIDAVLTHDPEGDGRAERGRTFAGAYHWPTLAERFTSILLDGL
ncbi:MAG: glycosyltransferase family 4 protein [Myxococcota bacterium]